MKFGKIDMGVSKNRGTPKWMVYMENPIKMDDLGVPPFSETPICNGSSKVLADSGRFSTAVQELPKLYLGRHTHCCPLLIPKVSKLCWKKIRKVNLTQETVLLLIYLLAASLTIPPCAIILIIVYQN